MMRQLIYHARPVILMIVVTGLLITTGFLAISTTKPAMADPERLGSISGVVRDRAGTPVSDIQITIRGDSVRGSIRQEIVTDGMGRYSFGLLPAGRYFIQLDDDAERYPSPQFYQDAINLQDATPIVVAGEAITDFDLTIEPGGEFRGRITAPDGSAVANVVVNAYERYSTSTPAQQGVTDLDGRYVITGLAANFYYLEFIDPSQLYYPKFYGDSPTYYEATLVSVSASGQVEGLNTSLVRGSTISGQVTGSGGQPLADIFVQARQLGGSIRRTTTSDAEGNYRVGGLDAGRYALTFSDSTGRYASNSYSNVEFGNEVEIGELEDLTDVNIRLARLGMVQGTVTDESQRPLADVRVRAIPQDSFFATRIAHTDETGNYLLDGLSIDAYHIEFSKSESLYLREYYSNATTLAASTPVTVFLGNILTDVNTSLSVGGAITGVVTHVDGGNLRGLQIRAFPQSTPMTATHFVFTDVVGSHYTYTLGGLPAEPHSVAVQALGNLEYYDNTTVQKRATFVPVIAGQFTSNVNFVLGDDADAATLSGTVRSTLGEPLENVRVSLYCQEPCGSSPVAEEPAEIPVAAGTNPTWNFLRSSYTNDTGHYRFGGLQPRSYRLRFTPSLSDKENRYAFIYHENAIDLASATNIELQPFGVRNDLNATLDVGGAITGVVTVDGYPLRGEEVTFHFWDGYRWEEIANARTDSLTGAYVRPALQTGRYRVEVAGRLSGELYQYYYGNTDIFTDATDVNITAGLTTANINLNLSSDAFLNAAITGTVTANGQPLPNIRVELYRYYDDSPSLFAITDNTGRYRLPDLGDGRYSLAFVDPTATYAISYTRGMTTFEPTSGRLFSVAANRVVTDVNAELVRGGALQGQVIDAAGNGLGQIEIEIYTQVGERWRQALPPFYSDVDGSYQTPGLLTGQYRLYFRDPFYRYPSRYFPNSPSLALAADVMVVAGEMTAVFETVMSRNSPRTWRLYLPVVAR